MQDSVSLSLSADALHITSILSNDSHACPIQSTVASPGTLNVFRGRLLIFGAEESPTVAGQPSAEFAEFGFQAGH